MQSIIEATSDTNLVGFPLANFACCYPEMDSRSIMKLGKLVVMAKHATEVSINVFMPPLPPRLLIVIDSGEMSFKLIAVDRMKPRH